MISWRNTTQLLSLFLGPALRKIKTYMCINSQGRFRVKVFGWLTNYDIKLTRSLISNQQFCNCVHLGTIVDSHVPFEGLAYARYPAFVTMSEYK